MLTFRQKLRKLCDEFIFGAKEEVREMITDTNATDSLKKFACDLYGTFNNNENLFFSPHSISAALFLAYLGAKGYTAAQMYDALRLSATKNALEQLMELASSQDDKITLTAANAAWVREDYKILEEYRRMLATALRTIDFSQPEEASDKVNKWVEENTNNLIHDLVSPDMFDELTQLILTNVIYFKGAWTKAFDSKRTTKQQFNCLNGDKTSVDMMFAKKMDLCMVATNTCKAVRLPYGNGSMSMLVILPKDFKSYGDSFHLTELKRIQVLLDDEGFDEVDIYLPKFKFEGKLSLNNNLMGLGIMDAFGPKADFSLISGNKDLFISDVLHKAIIDVSEEGTEAAAATAMVMRYSCMRESKRFTVDRPFIFAICEKGGAPLFMGHIVSLGEK